MSLNDSVKLKECTECGRYEPERIKNKDLLAKNHKDLVTRLIDLRNDLDCVTTKSDDARLVYYNLAYLVEDLIYEAK